MVKKLISVFLAAVTAITALTIPASAAEKKNIWGSSVYEQFDKLQFGAVELDVTKKNVFENKEMFKGDTAIGNTVFLAYKFTLKQKDTITVKAETETEFKTHGICAFVFNDEDKMYYDYNDFTFKKESKFDSNTFSFSIKNLPKGNYYLILTGTSTTEGLLSLEISAKKSLQNRPKVTATAAGNGKVKLKWKKIEGATKYRVSKVASGKYKTLKTTTKTSYTVSGLVKGNIYRFTVQAYVNGKWTTVDLSEIVEVTVR